MKKENLVCNKCNCEVFESEIEGYSYQCLECDEDLYAFEVHRNEKLHCNKCECEVSKSELEEYKYQCFECDEDLYTFEVH